MCKWNERSLLLFHCVALTRRGFTGRDFISFWRDQRTSSRQAKTWVTSQAGLWKSGCAFFTFSILPSAGWMPAPTMTLEVTCLWIQCQPRSLNSFVKQSARPKPHTQPLRDTPLDLYINTKLKPSRFLCLSATAAHITLTKKYIHLIWVPHLV